MVNFVDEYSDDIRPRLTVAVPNGEIAFGGASGEFFCQHANRLRERARVRQLFFFGYCNGYHQYFPTIEAAAEGRPPERTVCVVDPEGIAERLAGDFISGIPLGCKLSAITLR